jgi:hypothetical protein
MNLAHSPQTPTLRLRILKRTCMRIIWSTILGFSISGTSEVTAQEKRIEIVHKPISANSLPTAAATMPIVVELRHTKAVDRKIRLVGTRDGKLLDIVFPSGTLNMSDAATYTLDVPAPIALMSYQFVVHQPDGSLTTTSRYVVKRPCIQTFKVDPAENQKDGAFKREVGTLVSKSRTLEQETTNLETAQKLLEEIKTLLP